MKQQMLMKQSLLCVVIRLAVMLFIGISASSAQDAVPRFEVGGQFSVINRHKPTPLTDVIIVGDDDRENRYGFGARLTYNLTEHVALEAEGNFFPKKNRTTDLSGPDGDIYQAQFGVKVGKRFSKFGVFGKARPGFVRFTEVSKFAGTRTITVNNQQFTVADFSLEKENYFSTDIGGVVEFYPARRVVTRLDIGDTVIRYGSFQRAGFFLSQPVIERPAETKHSLQFSIGVGFRF